MNKKFKTIKFFITLEKDETSEYYLLEDNRPIWQVGRSREDVFNFLVDNNIIHLRRAYKYGAINFIDSVNAIIDGKNKIGRYSFIRVGKDTKSLERQLYEREVKFFSRFDSEFLINKKYGEQ